MPSCRRRSWPPSARVILCVVGIVTGAAPRARAQSPQDYVDRAVAAFDAGRSTDALAAFDALVALIPEVKPELWQRGIVLYDLGRYRECAEQFRAFHDLSPTDLEDAVWHFFCVARADSPAAARTALLRAGPDTRVMRTEVYAMVAGRITPAQVIEYSQNLPIALFYAHLYIGFYLDATGDPAGALVHLTEATDPKYSEFGGFMNLAARVYRDTLRRRMKAQ